MEFKITRLSNFIVITYLLNYAVPADLKIYHIECKKNENLFCCQVKCEWKPEDITQLKDADCHVFGKYMTCYYDDGPARNFTSPSISGRMINSDARCNIRMEQSNYMLSCYHNNKPICCDKPCECDLNLLNATCTMQHTEKNMDCSCAQSGSGNNPQIDFCFKSTCLNKTNKGACDFKTGDICYIYAGEKEQEQNYKNAEQVSREGQEPMNGNIVTQPADTVSPCNQNEGIYAACISISGICGIIIGIASSCIYYRKCSICSSCSGKPGKDPKENDKKGTPLEPFKKKSDTENSDTEENISD